MRYEFSEIAPFALEYAEKNKVSFQYAARIFLEKYERKTSQKNIKVLTELMQDYQEQFDAAQNSAQNDLEPWVQRRDDLLSSEQL